MAICKEPTCGRSAEARGWCHTHYQRWRRAHPEEIGPPGPAPRNTCFYCGIPIENPPPRRTGPRPRYCCADHRNKHYREGHVYRRYGMTIPDYEELLKKQGGVCAICGTDDPKAPGRKPRSGPFAGKGSFHVDHDHESKVVRGLLCSLCNRMLGQAQESSRNLRLGAEYLERFGR